MTWSQEDREKVVESIRQYLILGYSVNKACDLAGFKPSTFKTWMSNDMAFRQKVLRWQNEPNIQARKNVAEALLDGDKDMSKWHLERREKKFYSLRQEHTGKDGEPLTLKMVNYADTTVQVPAKKLPSSTPKSIG